MTLDGLTLAATVAELSKKLNQAKVQKVLMPAKEEVVLALYSAAEGNLRLSISADAAGCAMYLTAAARQNPKVPPSFCMLLRKHLLGAVVTAISQTGLERVVTLAFSAKDELMRPVELRLVVEIMGKYSNIILTDADGKILDSVRRVSADLSSKRQVLSGLPYCPPPQQKTDPLSASAEEIAALLRAGEDTRISARLTAAMGGVSTQTAAEIMHRADFADGSTSALSGQQALRIAQTLKDFLQNALAHPAPCVQQNADGLPVFFSCVPFETYPAAARVAFPSCNEALDYYYTRRAELFRLAQQRESLEKTIAKLLSRLEKRVAIYRDSVAGAQKAQKLQARAGLITANLYRLKKGMKSFTVWDPETGGEIQAPLDLSMTPQDLAQKLYKKAAKFKKAAAMGQQQLADALLEQEFLLGAQHFARMSQSADDVAEVRRTLAQAGFIAPPPKSRHNKDKQAESTPLRYISPGGYEILVGKNDRQNDILTMKTAGKDDLWFHAQKTPGSHVVLFTGGKSLDEIDDASIVMAAGLAALHSRAKQSGKTAVDYTARKNVKKPPGARPGKVTYDDYFTVYVEPYTDSNLKYL